MFLVPVVCVCPQWWRLSFHLGVIRPCADAPCIQRIQHPLSDRVKDSLNGNICCLSGVNAPYSHQERVDHPRQFCRKSVHLERKNAPQKSNASQKVKSQKLKICRLGCPTYTKSQGIFLL